MVAILFEVPRYDGAQPFVIAGSVSYRVGVIQLLPMHV